jgi:hypothetical protein
VELLSDGADLHGRSTAGEIDQRFFFIALPACECPPASLSDLSRATSIVHLPATTRSAFAVSCPARTSSTICST